MPLMASSHMAKKTTTKLLCVLAGEKGNAFSVEVTPRATIAELKETIRERKSVTRAGGSTRQIHMYLTAQDNTWMVFHDAKARMLKDGRYPGEMEMLMQTPSPPDATQVEACLQGAPGLEPGQIHIVVVWPKLLGFRVKDISEVFEHDALDGTVTYRRCLSFHVLIRESYAVIADRILIEDNSVVPKYATVIGTPGVGKYLMWRLLSDKKRVFLFHERGSVYFDGECPYDDCNVPSPMERFFWTPDLWCLVDATDPMERLDIPVAAVSVVLTTTSHTPKFCGSYASTSSSSSLFRRAGLDRKRASCD